MTNEKVASESKSGLGRHALVARLRPPYTIPPLGKKKLHRGVRGWQGGAL